MEFSILGPLEVRADGRAVPLGGVKPRALLAMLALHANEPLSAERLALALWGEDAPAGATKTVQVHVSRLRRALGDPDVLATTPAGYRLRVKPGELDAERFEALVGDGRTALAAGDADRAGALLRDALALWRGAPLADLADEPFARDEVAALEEQRLGAIELRVEADLVAGRHRELVAELGRLSREHPWRERLHAQHMLSLYRSGRQADALEAYRHARAALVEQLGVEPGAELQDLHRRILDHDPQLDAPSVGGAAPRPAAAARARRRGPRVAMIGAAALAVVALVVVIGLARDDGGAEEVRVPVDSVAVIDASREAVTRAIGVDEAPGPITSGAGLVWVLNLNSETVSRIDPGRGRVLGTQGLGDTPGNVAASAGEVWVAASCTLGGATGKLQHLYTAQQGGVETLGGDEAALTGAVPGAAGKGAQDSPACGLAAQGASAWVATNVPPGIARVDYSDRAASTTVIWGRALAHAPVAIATGAGSVWALDATDELVHRLDPRSGRVTAEARAGADPVGIAVGAGSVWVANSGDDSVSRIDPRTNAVSKSISVGDNPLAIAAGPDAVWVGSADGSVRRIDPDSEQVTATVSIGHQPAGLAVAGGQVFVSVRR